MIHGPVFYNGCGHDKKDFIGSFQIINYDGPIRIEKYDLYVFQQKHVGLEVCIRYGNFGGDYYSPGRLADFLMMSHGLEVYKNAAILLLSKYDLQITLKEIDKK